MTAHIFKGTQSKGNPCVKGTSASMFFAAWFTVDQSRRYHIFLKIKLGLMLIFVPKDNIRCIFTGCLIFLSTTICIYSCIKIYILSCKTIYMYSNTVISFSTIPSQFSKLWLLAWTSCDSISCRTTGPVCPVQQTALLKRALPVHAYEKHAGDTVVVVLSQEFFPQVATFHRPPTFIKPGVNWSLLRQVCQINNHNLWMMVHTKVIEIIGTQTQKIPLPFTQLH